MMSSASKPACSIDRDAERLDHLADQAHLLAQDVGRRARGWPCRSATRSWRNVGSGRSKATAMRVGLVVAHQVDEHRREAEDGVGDLARGRGHVGRQGEERPVGERVPVDEHEPARRRWYALGPRRSGRPSGLRRRGSSSPSRTRSATARMVVRRGHGRLLDEGEGVGLGQAVLRPSAGPWPGRRRLRVSSCSSSVVRLVVQGLASRCEAAEGDLDGRDQVGRLERLDQVGRARRRRGPARSGRAG